MLILLDKPNVLILDEPDNDLDIDMLAVVENLLDSWPGTLLLITHDRYLMERVTDDQFALLVGKIRHVPGGVDEYLRLLDARTEAQTDAVPEVTKPREAATGLSAAEERDRKKLLAATERKLDALGRKADVIRIELKMADPSDYIALGDIQGRLHAAEQEVSDLEDEWVELSESLS
jgi:ATPase subunit of ABC transporter with duplicated ATPase domains